MSASQLALLPASTSAERAREMLRSACAMHAGRRRFIWVCVALLEGGGGGLYTAIRCIRPYGRAWLCWCGVRPSWLQE
eukprot:COSAG01_NODE_37_length_34085_cov_64.376626_7_plen_78_part_00